MHRLQRELENLVWIDINKTVWLGVAGNKAKSMLLRQFRGKDSGTKAGTGMTQPGRKVLKGKTL